MSNPVSGKRACGVRQWQHHSSTCFHQLKYKEKEISDNLGSHNCGQEDTILSPRGPRHPRTFFAAFRVTFLMQRVYFKPITWCISLYYMITYFTVWRHFFRIMGCLFTTCISLTGKLTAIELSAWPL